MLCHRYPMDRRIGRAVGLPCPIEDLIVIPLPVGKKTVGGHDDAIFLGHPADPPPHILSGVVPVRHAPLPLIDPQGGHGHSCRVKERGNLRHILRAGMTEYHTKHLLFFHIYACMIAHRGKNVNYSPAAMKYLQITSFTRGNLCCIIGIQHIL